MDRRTLTVTGMSCSGCEETVSNALGKLEGVNRVDADHEGDAVEVVASDDVTDEDIRDAIERAGYDVEA